MEHHKFSVGDRVKRFKGHNTNSGIGHEATIRAIVPLGSWDRDGPWLMFEDGTEGYSTSFDLINPMMKYDPAQQGDTEEDI